MKNNKTEDILNRAHGKIEFSMKNDVSLQLKEQLKVIKLWKQ